MLASMLLLTTITFLSMCLGVSLVLLVEHRRYWFIVMLIIVSISTIGLVTIAAIVEYGNV